MLKNSMASQCTTKEEKLLLEMIQHCVNELTITDRSGVVEHSHPPKNRICAMEAKKNKKKTLYQNNGKILSTTDNYHYYLTIIVEI